MREIPILHQSPSRRKTRAMDHGTEAWAASEHTTLEGWMQPRATRQLTGARKAILVALESANRKGRTATDLWIETGRKFDRVSIYRGTEWLVRALHVVRVTNDDRTSVFFLAPPDPTRFAVFECRHCGGMWRLAEAGGAGELWRPDDGAVVERQVLRAVGWCRDCQQDAAR